MIVLLLRGIKGDGMNVLLKKFFSEYGTEAHKLMKKIGNTHPPQWFWAVVQREKKFMAYDLHPVLIPYLVSQNS